MSFVLGLCIGIALGLIVIGFLAIGSYERGYDAASSERRRRHVGDRPGAAHA